jgi:hypothetical protein
LRLIEECPEVTDNSGRQHHQEDNDRRPQIVALNFLLIR